MQSYFDTSAVVPLLLREPHTPMAQAAWENSGEIWAWRWLQVEAEAALVRRKACPKIWRQWRAIAQRVNWLDASDDFHASLCAFNRAIGLRAADAGHLLVFDRATTAMPSLVLVTFDGEMIAAAARLGLPRWVG